MTQTNINSVLKGAQYAEEPTISSDHVQSFLIPVESTQGFVFGVLLSKGTNESFSAFEGIVHNHLDRLSTTIDPQTNLTHRFEQLLQALNEEVANAFHEGVFSLPISDTSAVVGVADQRTVIVSGFGALSAQFLHKSEKERYEIYDLGKGMRVEEEVPSWKKPFLTVLDGDLQPGDVLYIGSRLSRHDLSVSTMNDVLTTLPPNSAVNKIRQYLPTETIFTAVVLKTERSDESGFASDKVANASIKTLEKTVSKTDEFLSEQKPDVRKILLKIWLFVFPKNKAEDRRKRIRRLLKFLARLVIVFFVVAGQMLVGVFFGLVRLFRSVVTNPRAIINRVRSVKNHTDSFVRLMIGRFNDLSSTSKYILLGLFAIAFVFLSSILLLHGQQTRQLERLNYENSVKVVEKKIDNAEASLIYDEEQAKVLLNDALQLANNLQIDTKDREDKAKELQKLIQEKQNVLRHIVTVETTVTADATSLPENTKIASLVFFGETLNAISDSGDIFTIPKDGSTYQTVSVTKGDVQAPKAITTSDKAVYWLDTASETISIGLSRYLPETSEVSPLLMSREGVDLAFYANRLYILSPLSGQIYRHGVTTSGFDGGSAWVISGVSSLTDAVAMTIDGYVWVLKADGRVLRFLSGKETDWKSGIVEPPILNGKDLWTSETSTYLYILDPAEKRIVQLDKNSGDLVQQFTNDAFTDMKAMAVDETNKKIYVLAGNTVYWFGF